jgi:hypothetical protein
VECGEGTARTTISELPAAYKFDTLFESFGLEVYGKNSRVSLQPCSWSESLLRNKCLCLDLGIVVATPMLIKRSYLKIINTALSSLLLLCLAYMHSTVITSSHCKHNTWHLQSMSMDLESHFDHASPIGSLTSRHNSRLLISV